MARTFLSRPIQRAIDDGVVRPDASLFDYGCGRGGDIERLKAMGYDAGGWDPAHRPHAEIYPADVVNLGYVVNVIEDLNERRDAVLRAWSLTKEVLIVTARLDWEARGLTSTRLRDGVVTDHGTFQKFFEQDELRAWIDSSLGESSVAAEPGIFYVFRSAASEQRTLAHRSRSQNRRGAAAELWYRQHIETLRPLEDFMARDGRLPNPTEIENGREVIEYFGSVRNAYHVIRRATPPETWAHVTLPPTRTSSKRFEENLDALVPLMDFMTERGRLPRDEEIPDATEISDEFGSIRAAYSLIRKVTGPAQWADAESKARNDVIVYVALSALGNRPRWSDLPSDTGYDIKDFFGSYRAAIGEADKLLFATGNQQALSGVMGRAGFGKLTPEAYYVHTVGLPDLHPLLRVYEGCARVLTGEIPQANVLKMHREKPQVSYLIYPRFDDEGHPELLGSVVSRLGRLHVDYRSFAESSNPPILHRKELLVPPTYPGRAKFERLTRAEDKLGLLSRATIGTRVEWEAALQDAGVTVRGHTIRGIR